MSSGLNLGTTWFSCQNDRIERGHSPNKASDATTDIDGCADLDDAGMCAVRQVVDLGVGHILGGRG